MEIPDQSDKSPDTASLWSSGSPGCSLSPRFVALHMPCIGRGLYISGLRGVTNKKFLEHQNITHILNLARELGDTVFPDFVDVQHVYLRDSEEEDLQRQLLELVKHIHQVIDSGGRIVVNCVAGVSRSASVCLAYKVRYEGLSLREALDEVLKARPVICPNLAFWQALIQWEQEVRGENSVVMLPYICGMVPDLEFYKQHAEIQIKLGWMGELLALWATWLLILTLQAIVIIHG